LSADETSGQNARMSIVMRPDSTLEACVMNRLQKMKRQTLQELKKHCNRSEAEILVVLEVYRKVDYVRFENGAWTMVRGSGETK
jgi:hypothetical protein